MNYIKIYTALIERARDRNLDGYTEKHHIIPRCVGGSDHKDNIVKLTAREHFVAHLLLIKIYAGNYRLVKAAAMMCMGQKERKINNRIYGYLRQKLRDAQSICQQGRYNSQWNTRWIRNQENLVEQKIPWDMPTPSGWVDGRRKKVTETKIKPVRADKRLQNIAASRQHALDLYAEYLSGSYSSIRDFCKTSAYDKSHVALTLMWKKYVPDYVNTVQHGRRFRGNR